MIRPLTALFFGLCLFPCAPQGPLPSTTSSVPPTIGAPPASAAPTASAAPGVSAEPAAVAAPTASAELGVYLGAGCTGEGRLAAFSRWLGKSPDRILDFISFKSWTDMVSSSSWSTSCWTKATLPLTFSVPMLPHDDRSTLKEGANGSYDATFRALAESLVKNGFGRAILRVGWEFNGGWYPWAAAKDPESWKAYWRRIASVMRSVAGAAFRFDWCPTAGSQQIEHLYPGDDAVDIIGMDVYNQTWDASATTPEKRWHNTQFGQYGLEWLARFAAEHHKPMSIPEWGTGTRPDGHGGGDDPLFITNMAHWISSHDVVYQVYWDYHAHDFDAALSDGKQPLSERAFLDVFGVAKPLR
jgi:hypothetical protein